ncbi:MAG TPA: hypothetical protein VK424_06285 [Thermoplasmata archaeon]|nr:hypothetical protein [Thermoplasmata archaeon]
MPNSPGPTRHVAPCPPDCPAVFTEVGLPGDPVTWTITMNGTSQSSTNSTIVFVLLNATYPWGVSAPGYSATPSHGVIVIQGFQVNQTINFTANATSPAPSSGLSSEGLAVLLGGMGFAMIVAVVSLVLLGKKAPAVAATVTPPPRSGNPPPSP